ncbi:MAG: YggS family pyridoxal phosphate-dependent enzyme [Bacteroidaceae bacterium]|nr:YggS family pyridoxal phosphate-dependent enzyme [Bacteroidaceae bacterium]
MSSIAERLNSIRATIPAGVRLLAISKYYPVKDILEAYNAGQRDFGENKAQDLVAKQQALPADIRWHFTGHLQSNKIKYIAPFVYMIHSVDSVQLLREINKYGAKNGRVIPCLLQIHIAQEETKFGFTPEECLAMLASEEWKELKNVHIRGLMCMASNTDDTQQVASEFVAVRALFDEIRGRWFADDEEFDTLSAGMSGDYLVAIESGSTCVRIGSSIFEG